MRRGRALLTFGFVATTVCVATLSARSLAANGVRGVAAEGPSGVGERGNGPRLLPLLAKGDALFGSFVKPSSVPDFLPTNEACALDMVEVDGDYCPTVQQKCLRWLDPDTKLQCAEFAKTGEQGPCPAKPEHKRFCVDRYEWPNRVGALPTYMVNWNEAKASCESVGKRLCDDTEWTLACEGPERQPYPYGMGYSRDNAACNIDKPYIWPHPERLFDVKTQTDELAQLDQREPSGARPSCVSPFGVRDMVGNVDEWVVNASQAGQPFKSGLKGGYWGPVRTRCRPMTTAHNETFRYYQIGFRCCGQAREADLGASPLASR